MCIFLACVGDVDEGWSVSRGTVTKAVQCALPKPSTEKNKIKSECIQIASKDLNAELFHAHIDTRS